MGYSWHFNLHFRVNSLFHYLCSQCYAAQHSYEVISCSTDIHVTADCFIAWYTVLMRPNKVETAVHGCKCWLSVWTLSCRCPVKLFTQYQPCIIVCYFLVWADQIFYRSCVHWQHFRLRSFASSCFTALWDMAIKFSFQSRAMTSSNLLER